VGISCDQRRLAAICRLRMPKSSCFNVFFAKGIAFLVSIFNVFVIENVMYMFEKENKQVGYVSI